MLDGARTEWTYGQPERNAMDEAIGRHRDNYGPVFGWTRIPTIAGYMHRGP